ncbi:MAG: Hsp70 family protein, partial [Acidobacteria bacterium]|nr:Hsp70 family protein [Acidobacteriota bacterium]
AHQFIPLIRRNSKLPATRTEAFFTVFEDQEAVEIKVYQGEDPDALKNVEIGTFMFSGLNEHEGAHEQGLLFTYRLDLDGLLHVHARERATGRELRGVVENAIGRSSDEALGAARERVSALWGETGNGVEAGAEAAGDVGAGGGAEESPAPAALPPDVAGEVEATLARAEQALEAAPAEDREEMVNLMEDLRDALREGEAERAAALRRELDEILFYLE